MTTYRLFNNFLDFKKNIRIDNIYKDYESDGYKVSLYVLVTVPKYYILQAILELIMHGYRQDVMLHILKMSQYQYKEFLWELKEIVGMDDKTVVYMRKNRELAEERFGEYFAGN